MTAVAAVMTALRKQRNLIPNLVASVRRNPTVVVGRTAGKDTKAAAGAIGIKVGIGSMAIGIHKAKGVVGTKAKRTIQGAIAKAAGASGRVQVRATIENPAGAAVDTPLLPQVVARGDAKAETVTRAREELVVARVTEPRNPAAKGRTKAVGITSVQVQQKVGLASKVGRREIDQAGTENPVGKIGTIRGPLVEGLPRVMRKRGKGMIRNHPNTNRDGNLDRRRAVAPIGLPERAKTKGEDRGPRRSRLRLIGRGGATSRNPGRALWRGHTAVAGPVRSPVANTSLKFQTNKVDILYLFLYYNQSIPTLHLTIPYLLIQVHTNNPDLRTIMVSEHSAYHARNFYVLMRGWEDSNKLYD